MLYGYYLVGSSGNGCQHNTIKNCAVTLTRTWYNSVCVMLWSNATSTSGINSYNKFYNNTIRKSSSAGYNFTGNSTYYDEYNEVGTINGGTSIITQIGDSAYSAPRGVIFSYNKYGKVFNTNFSNFSAVNTCYGVYSYFGTLNSFDIYSNDFTSFNAVSGTYIYPILVSGGSFNIYSNTIHDISVPSFTSKIYGIFVGSSSSAIVYSNHIYNLSAGNGAYGVYGISFEGTIPTYSLYSNNIHDLTNSNNVYGLYINANPPALFSPNSGGNNIYSNNIYNLSGGFPNATGVEIKGGTVNFYKNSINNINYTASDGYEAIGLNYSQATASSTNNVYNNLIYDVKSANSITPLYQSNVYGLKIATTNAATVNLYNNTVYLDYTSASATNVSTVLYLGGNTTLDMRNNILSNNANMSTGTMASVFRNSSTDYSKYASTSNFNLMYAGTPSSKNLIFYDGTNSEQTFDGYLSRIGSLKDDNSLSGNPGFTSSSSPYNLIPDVNNSNSWHAKGGAYPLTDVTDDFNGTARRTAVNQGPEDLGAYKFGTPTTESNPLTVSGSIGDGTTTTLTFGGKTLATIVWHTGTGTLPSAITAQYRPGVVPPGSLANSYAYEYLDISTTGGDLNYTYEFAINYNLARTYNIDVTDASKLRVSRYKSGNWAGLVLNTTVNTTTKIVTTTGIVSGAASDKTLTNTDSPLPVKLNSFTSTVKNRNAVLNWVTSSEINNTGFNIERKTTESGWQKIGFVAGKGTINTQTSYTFSDTKLNSGKYQYRLKQIDNNGNFEYHNLSGEVEVGLPTKYELSQNYPNPFNPLTKIDFQLPNDGKVTLVIYDITGREMATLLNNEFKKADYYTVMFNGSNLSSGVYFYRIAADKYVMTKKMVLVK
jgi:hypothetical protein